MGETTPPAFVQAAANPVRWRMMTLLAESDLRVRDLVALLDEPQNLVSYHLRLLRDQGLVTARRSSFDGRESYYHLDLERCSDAVAAAGHALHPAIALNSTPPGKPKTAVVLFVCTGNSARSPMAEALLRHHTRGRVRAISAGTKPRPRQHPLVTRALREIIGVDIAEQHPRDVGSVLSHQRFNRVITLCDRAREALPQVDAHRTHWSLPDPAGGPEHESFRRFLDTAREIDARVRHLLPLLAEERRPA
jgi:protein-tyrosine-phosphatase/DNA-binding transcriptional ArsR family regulator